MSNWITKIEFAVGATVLALITLLVFAAAIARFFGNPIIWSVDMAQLLFIWLCFIGATKAMRERGHLGVDFLVRLFSHRWRLITETILAVIFIIVMYTLGVQGHKLAVLNMERVFGDSGISYYYVTMAVPIGFILLSLQIIANTVDAWINVAKGDRLIFARKGSVLDQVTEL